MDIRDGTRLTSIGGTLFSDRLGIGSGYGPLRVNKGRSLLEVGYGHSKRILPAEYEVTALDLPWAITNAGLERSYA